MTRAPSHRIRAIRRNHLRRRMRTLMCEQLETRTVLAQWLLQLDTLTGETIDAQIQEVQALLQAEQIDVQQVAVVGHLGRDGNIVLETPEDQGGDLVYQLFNLPGFISLEPYSRNARPASPIGDVVADEGIGPGANLAVGLSGNEPHVAVNPLNPNNVVVASYNNGTQSMKISLDGGATFPITRNGVLVPGQTFFQGDDSLAFDANGRLFWSYLSGGSPSGPNLTVVQVNPSTGAVIGSPTLVATSNLDKQWLAADANPASPFANNLYMAWHDFNLTNAPVRFARSTNQGLTWTTLPGNLSGASQGFTWPCEVAVSPNGDVWVAWHTNTGGTNGEVRMRRSTDGGLTFGPEIIPFPAGTAATTTNSASGLASKISGLHVWLQGSMQPRILTDPARPGNIYVVCVDDPDGFVTTNDPSDIVIARSTDNGATWTRSTISQGTYGNSEFMPSASIDASGNITVTWYDNRRGLTVADSLGGTHYLLDLFAANSFDGGITFSTPLQVNDPANTFDPERGAPDRFGNHTLRIGEYNGVALAGGTAHAVWAGNTATGQQIYYNKYSLGLVVTSTVPTGGSIVATQPTTFTVNVSSPVNPATLQASDFQVNGLPADSVAYTNGTSSITFGYSASPVTVQGVQTMHIDAGAFSRASDDSPLLQFNSTFNYDAVQLQVASTAPSFPNGILTLPGPFTYDVTFNEEINSLSVQASDLVLTGAAGAVVSGVTVLPDNLTARFTISGISAEAALTASIAAGKVADVFGNPNNAFSATYQVDYGTFPYPTPLVPKNPAGSLIYDPSLSGTINFAGDMDTFTLNVDPGQTITVLVDPAGSPDPALYGGVGNGAGTAAGQLLLINQTNATSTIVGDPVTPGGLSGLVFDPASGVFLGTSIQSLANASNLVRIDPNTGALLGTIGTIRVGSAAGPTIPIGDLAIQPGTDLLYAVRSNSGSAGSGELYTIDKATAIATLVGTTGSGAGGGLAFAPNGDLFQTAYNSGFDFASLNKIDPATAARISTVALPTYFDGLTIRADGTFFAAQGGSGTSIYTINPTTGATSLVGNTSATTSDLAFRPSTAVAPAIELRDPANVVLSTASAGNGRNALLQTVDTTTGGTYSIVVSGAGSSTGGYSVQVVLNAALETEGIVVGSTNNSQATAQDLAASFLDLGLPIQDTERGAVLGSVQAGGNLIANGSFETGSFTSWTTATTNTPFRPWTVSGAGTGGGFGMLTTAPQDGSSVAWNGFDGNGPMEYTMRQDLALPAASSLLLSWSDRLQWNFFTANAQSRTYLVEVRNPTTNALLATLYSFSTGSTPVNVPQNTGWVTHTADLSAFAGTTVRLQFREVIPQANTGPGQAEIDAISLNVSSDSDWYKFTLGAGETSTVALKALSGAGSALSLQVFDSSGTPLPANFATSANLDHVATFTAPTSDEYFVRVVSASGIISYSLVATKNAAFDTETNNTFSSAQDVSGRRGAVGAITAATTGGIAINALDSGWIASDGTHSTNNNNYFVGQATFNNNPTAELRNYATFALSAALPTITGAELRLFAPTNGYRSSDPTEIYSLFDVSAAPAALDANRSAGDVTGIALHGDLGTGTAYGSRVVSAADNGTTVAVALNVAALTALNAARGSTIALGGAITSLAGTAQQSLFASSNGALGTVQLVLQTESEADWYTIDVGAASPAIDLRTFTLADGPGELVNNLNPRIELFDPLNTLVASGFVLPDGRNESIHYQPLIAGSYRVRVTGEGNSVGEYFLSKNFAPLVTSLNVSSPIAENVTASLSGAISDPDPLDTHRVVIDWGPGEGTTTIDLPAGVFTFSATHPYLDDNPSNTNSDLYPISVTVTDNSGAIATAGTSIQVDNVAPVLGTASTDATPAEIAVVGETVSATVAYTDVGTQDTHTVMIDWGDGNSSPGTAVGGAASGTHEYSAGGIYTVTMTVTDDDTSAIVATTTAYVTGVGVLDGQLQIIGTNGDDHVSVNLAGSAESRVVRVHASFLPLEPGFVDVPLADVGSLLVMLFDGDDHASLAGNLELSAVLDGGAGDDHLKAGRAGAVLLGGLGNDILLGGLGNDILIGGSGADMLTGGSDEDILIGGMTSYDANTAALFALLREWTSMRSLIERTENLRTGNGPELGGRKLVKGDTVFDDSDRDLLVGSAGVDWYFYLTGQDDTGGISNELQN